MNSLEPSVGPAPSEPRSGWHAVPCALFKRFEEEQKRRWKDADAKWNLQRQRNDHEDALFRRWGASLDQLQLTVAEQGQNTDAFRRLLDAQRHEAERTTKLLEELATGLKQTNERAVQNHQSLMTAISNAFGISTGATARADRAHSEAEQAAREAKEAAEQALTAAQEARKASEERTTLTRGALLAWGIALTGISAWMVRLIGDYGWPVIREAIDAVMGASP